MSIEKVNVVPFVYPSPISFTPKLSPIEMLAHLQGVINEVIASLENIDEKSSEYTDEQIKLLKETVIKDLENQIIFNYDSLREIISNQYSTITNNYTELINKSIEELIIYIDNGDRENYNLIISELKKLELYLETFRKEIEDYVQNALDNVKILSPVTGKEESVQDVINDIANLLKGDSITIAEFDALQITVLAFDNLDISCFNFDFYAKRYL